LDGREGGVVFDDVVHLFGDVSPALLHVTWDVNRLG
jgi:hypothetical protein